MKAHSSYVTYKQLDAQCSGPQLVILLCDGAIRFTKEAAEHMRAQRLAEKGKAVEAAYECIAELRNTLDFKQGGEVASSLDKTYDLLATKLSLANTSLDAVQLDQIVASLTTIRSSWSELFERLAKEGKLREQDVVPKVLAPAL
jgi:flagellar protein FliS